MNHVEIEPETHSTLFEHHTSIAHKISQPSDISVEEDVNPLEIEPHTYSTLIEHHTSTAREIQACDDFSMNEIASYPDVIESYHLSKGTFTNSYASPYINKFEVCSNIDTIIVKFLVN